MKILFCTDGSTCSYNALKDILTFVSKNVTFDILHVIDSKFFLWNIKFTQKDIKETYTRQAESILEETQNIIKDNGINIEKCEFKQGDIAETILNQIKNGDYSLVVLGSHGKKGLKKWIGSVSKKVVTKTEIPAFVSGTSERYNKQAMPKKYLIAVDGSKCSKEAIKKATEIFDFENAQTTLLTVKSGIEIFPVEITMDAAWLDVCLKKQQELAEEILNTTATILSAKNINFEQKILEGNIAEEILSYSQEEGYSIIILGSHGREGLSEYLLGSISKRILDNSQIPVLIVPTKI